MDRGPGLIVLAVDDNADDLTLLEDGFLECGTAVELITATSALMALAEFMQSEPGTRPDVAVIDINMPLVSGFELASHLLLHDVCTLMMTSHVDEMKTAKARSIGVAELLVKPSDYAGYILMARRIVHAVQARR